MGASKHRSHIEHGIALFRRGPCHTESGEQVSTSCLGFCEWVEEVASLPSRGLACFYTYIFGTKKKAPVLVTLKTDLTSESLGLARGLIGGNFGERAALWASANPWLDLCFFN